MPEYDHEGRRHRDGDRDRDRDRERSKKRKSSTTKTKQRSNSANPLSAEALAALSSGEVRAAQSGSEGRPREHKEHREGRERRERRDQRGQREPREDDRERQERREKRERRERRERRDRREAEEREARRQREEAREIEEREAALSTPRRTTRAYTDSEAEPDSRRHSRSRPGRDRTRSRHYTEDERTDHERTDYESDRRRRRRHSRPEKTHRASNSRAKYTSLQTGGHHDRDHDDNDSDSGYDRVPADGAADRRHQWKRDRRIPSGAVLEEGRSRGVWERDEAAAALYKAKRAKKPQKSKAGRDAEKSSTGSGLFGWLNTKPAAAAADAVPLKPKEKKSSSGFGFSWLHLRGGGHAGQSSMSSGDSRNSIDRAKENLYYSSSKPPKKSKPWSKKKKMVVFGGLGSALLVLVIVIVAVVVSKKNSKDTSSSSSSSGSIISDVPTDAPSWLNPYKWVSTTDFNLTYTNETVGGLPVMGLNTSYDDSKAANSKTAALDEDWGSYGTTPARGVNLGGWLSIEPFITPSLFSGYDTNLGIIDEYTLCAYLGSAKCSSTLENHYATFVTESTFAEIAAAGLDHVRIQYSYWAVAVYDDDPYLFRTSWRYLLRGIEWARKHGLRVNLDLHGLPGSQNGWNHSGRQGTIGWMNGTNGDLNVQRSLEVHDALSQFFAQPRYKNVLSHYGLANEPRMTFLSVSSVMAWTQEAAALIRKNGLNNDTIIVFGDGFCGLSKWQGQPNTYNLALDVHQYEIFNNEQIVYTHEEKIQYACSDWTTQTEDSMDTATGFGPTIVAEWSQADTDCSTYLGNVGNGNRWTGTYDVGNASLNALTPKCPAQNSSCSCTQANSDVSSYSDEYKTFLLMFAEAQMDAFELGWGWWYWTWDTESAPQWSYKQGLAAGILPADASSRSFSCNSSTIPSFDSLSEFY